ncbi:aminoglycoside phosphotransferase family protein [Streptomyces sp. SCSIO 30461]|uniref:phosphotransferase family protein n=1 Tax=Streptomyces sp. SCSIO 30461 TaxID=3118085 RepID=UPI0030D3C8A4
MDQGHAPLVRALSLAARSAAHPSGRDVSCGSCRSGGQRAEVLAQRDDAVVVRHGTVVAKAHAPGTDSEEHRIRLAVAAHPALDGILLAPVRGRRRGAGDRVDGRPVTIWPYGSPVDPAAPDAAPWEDAAVLLARLHRVAVDRLPWPLPPMRGPLKAAAAVKRLPRHPAARPVLAAWHGLPPWARAETPAPYRPQRLCHGDMHLGQLVRHPADHGPWLLIDADDLGIGDPAWDLARPAAWFAAGLLPPDDWARFLTAYRAAGGAAVWPVPGDPWAQLDVPARALTVQTAALGLARSVREGREPDEVELLMIDSCARIASLPTDLDSAGTP